MKIIYIGSFRFPFYDAAAARVLNNARALRLCGHEVKFISWGGKYNNDDLCNDNKYLYDGFEYVISNDLDFEGGFLSKVKRHLRRGQKSLELLKWEVSSCDVIISYNAEYHFTKKLFKIANHNKIKFVNDITEWYSSKDLYLIDRLSNILNMRYLQHRVKNKIVISHYLNNYYKNAHNIVLPPLCDTEEDKWKCSNLTNLSEATLKFNGLRFIYAGNPAKKDMLHTAINAIQRLLREGANIQFLIVGITRKDYLSSYSSLLDNTVLNANIVFLGKVPQKEVPAYYMISDFMILLREPTRKNMAGFPTKFVESMTAGVPIIANITSDLEHYLQDLVNGFVLSDHSTEQLYKTIKNRILTVNKEEILQMKKKTKLKGKEFFDYRSAVNEFAYFINNMK